MITQIKKRLHRLFSIGIGWNEISQHFSHVELDEYIIMPNHIHGVINIVKKYKINNVGAPLVGALNISKILKPTHKKEVIPI